MVDLASMDVRAGRVGKESGLSQPQIRLVFQSHEYNDFSTRTDVETGLRKTAKSRSL